ncbi:MAG: aspartate aminotransferase family protein [Rhizobiales bacterium]|nr:aspartate aminotransferase family protein [Hyphomicrobiales bacterium]MBI3672812.1 aspartate aminotransferase family protein [Hyphomicrobiales bacterium]
MPQPIRDTAIAAMLDREARHFIQRNPRSRALSEEAAKNWLRGVPMHWMVDWGTPFPLFVADAKGVDLTDADGNAYIDFCLGDTGAMFGHSPPPVVETLQREGASGFTTMIPSVVAAEVGKLLADRFGLPFWQVTATASDANRAVLRWCRAITGRQKILVFNHCYHGAVDETYVTIDGGTPHADPALIGEPRDLTALTKVVEFNDVAALEAALAPSDVACVLAEPVMTNVGMVLPDEGYHTRLRQATRRTGTLLIIDETHCMSSGPGGYTRAHGLEPDGLVLGKPIAGGLPAAVYGFSSAVAERIRSFLEKRTPGHSGIGTTLSGSKIQLALMRTVIETYFTDAAFAPLIALAEELEQGLAQVIARRGVPWHVVRVGARVEFMCSPRRPRNGGEAAQLIHRPADRAIHHHLLNRGVIITPFHNMMLICPATTEAHVAQLVEGVDRCIAELTS